MIISPFLPFRLTASHCNRNSLAVLKSEYLPLFNVFAISSPPVFSCVKKGEHLNCH